jgi:hypothetical protein
MLFYTKLLLRKNNNRFDFSQKVFNLVKKVLSVKNILLPKKY